MKAWFIVPKKVQIRGQEREISPNSGEIIQVLFNIPPKVEMVTESRSERVEMITKLCMTPANELIFEECEDHYRMGIAG